MTEEFRDDLVSDCIGEMMYLLSNTIDELNNKYNFNMLETEILISNYIVFIFSHHIISGYDKKNTRIQEFDNIVNVIRDRIKEYNDRKSPAYN